MISFDPVINFDSIQHRIDSARHMYEAGKPWEAKSLLMSVLYDCEDALKDSDKKKSEK